MDQRATIFLGDLVRAIRDLKPADDQTRKLIAEMLGLNLNTRLPLQQTPAPRAQTIKPPTIPTINDPLTPVVAPVSDSVPISLELHQNEEAEWISDVKPLPRLQPEHETYVRPQLEPLLLPQWTRGILIGSLATKTEDGLPDLERITETLARGEVIRALPTLSSPTLRRGVQLLIDKSQAMMPFIRDQAWLQKEIRQVAGMDRVEIKRFAGSPLRGAGAGPKPWPEYTPPLPGTPVMLLTDLGICQPMLTDDWADSTEWLRFCRTVRHANCPLIAFVPYGPSRWPKELARALPIIQWDRKTTAATVRGVIGRGLEVSSR
jgi:hypothetical protein